MKLVCEMNIDTQEMLFKVPVTVSGSQLILKSVFIIHFADYNIDVPSLYVLNLAEEVEIRVDATLSPYVKS